MSNESVTAVALLHEARRAFKSAMEYVNRFPALQEDVPTAKAASDLAGVVRLWRPELLNLKEVGGP